MITSEQELQDELVIQLTEQGFNCQQYVPCFVGIADVVVDNAVIELKHLPDREALFKAVGQAVLYRGAIDKNLDAKIICSYYDELSLLRLQSAAIAVKQLGIELIPWTAGDSLVFQTDSIYSIYSLPFIYEVGDICTVSSLCRFGVLEYNKCWAVITEVCEYGCLVQLVGEEVFLRTQHLKKLDLEVEQVAQIKLVSDRIKRLKECSLDAAEYAVLQVIAKNTCFSSKQMALLEFLEGQYGI